MRDVLNILLDPFIWCFAALFVGSALAWRSSSSVLARRALAGSVLLMTLICTPAVAMLALATLEHPYPPRFERPSDVSTIVVLGGGTLPPNAARPQTALGLSTAMRCMQALH